MTINKTNLIAVVGVSHNPEKYGYKIFADLLNFGYKVKGVNVKGGEILGQKLSSSLSDLKNFEKEIPDLVIAVVPPRVTLEIVKDCIELNIKNIWMQPGSESDEAVDLAEKNNMEVISNACFMVKEGLW